MSLYRNKYIAIDTSLVLYKNISALRNSGKDLTDKNGNITSHIFAIIQNFQSTLYRRNFICCNFPNH